MIFNFIPIILLCDADVSLSKNACHHPRAEGVWLHRGIQSLVVEAQDQYVAVTKDVASDVCDGGRLAAGLEHAPVTNGAAEREAVRPTARLPVAAVAHREYLCDVLLALDEHTLTNGEVEHQSSSL